MALQQPHSKEPLESGPEGTCVIVVSRGGGRPSGVPESPSASGFIYVCIFIFVLTYLVFSVISCCQLSIVPLGGRMTSPSSMRRCSFADIQSICTSAHTTPGITASQPHRSAFANVVHKRTYSTVNMLLPACPFSRSAFHRTGRKRLWAKVKV